MAILVAVRLRNAAAMLVLASLLCFALVVSAPGNVAVLVAELRNPKATFEEIHQVEEELGLNKPLIARYGMWLTGALTGNLGISYKTGQNIGDTLASRLPITLTLILGGASFATLLSFALGFIGALWPGRIGDAATRVLALLGASMPSFFVGALLIYGLAVQLRLFPTFGSEGLTSWVLPWMTIGFLPAAVLSRVVRVGLEEAMARPFTLTATAKGLSRGAILLRHALPTIAPTYVNALGAQCGAMVVGAVVVEPLFALKGVSDLFLQGVLFRDFMVVQACLLVFLTFFIILNLAVDIAIMFLDPKLRRQGAGA